MATRLEILGQNIQKYRKKAGLSQNQLAEMIDLSREHLSVIETGKSYISLKRIFMLADIFEISVKDLITFD